jgi:hypothetical protein
MIPKALEAITEADLLRLISEGVPESKSLDYKAELPPDNRDGHREFLKDVSALANTDGGDLLYGVAEQGGLATALPGLDVPNQDMLRQQLENRLRDGLQPRIPDVRLHFISVSGKHVLVVRVARSWAAPHRVSAGGHGHFYARNSAGVFGLDVDQLRAVFLLSEAIEQRIKEFKVERLSKISAGAHPIPVIAGVNYVVHLLPLSSFAARNVLSMENLRSHAPRFAYLDSMGYSQRINVDGLVMVENRRSTSAAYTQVFRNGCIEAVAVFEELTKGGKPQVPAAWCEWQTIKSLQSYTKGLFALGIAPPFFVFVSLVNALGSRLNIDRWLTTPGEPLDRPALQLPEAVIDREDASIGLALKPTFDSLWHAFGYDRTLNLNDAGEWVGPK